MQNKSWGVKINGGVHMHGILLLPERSRLKEWMKAHVKRHENRYVRNNLLRLKVQPIQSNPQKVVGYGFKSLKNRLFNCDDILSFPKAKTI
jgi:hypothetical protein